MIEHCPVCGSILAPTDMKHRGFCGRCHMNVKTLSERIDSVEQCSSLDEYKARP
jgi:hypothetical protein